VPPNSIKTFGLHCREATRIERIVVAKGMAETLSRTGLGILGLLQLQGLTLRLIAM